MHQGPGRADSGETWETRHWPAFTDLPAALSDTLAVAEADDFELGVDWFAHLAATGLAPGERAGLFETSAAGTPASRALLPVIETGRRARALATFYSALYAPACVGDGRGALTALFRHLAGQGRSRLRLAPMDPVAPAYADTLAALRAGGWRVYPFFCFGNWYLPVAGHDFDAYLRARPSRLRNTLERRRRGFLADGRGRLDIVRGGPELDAAIAAWQRIYLASWKRPEPFPDFMPGLIRLCARRGWLRLGLAHYDGEPVAAQVWIVHAGRAAIYKLAHDEQRSPPSAGSLLTAHLMRAVIEDDRVGEVDYLIGDEPYKRDWMTHRRERWGLLAFNPRSVDGLAGALAEGARRAGRRMLNALGRVAGHDPRREKPK